MNEAERGAEDAKIANNYKGECAKVAFSKGLASCDYRAIIDAKGSLTAAILDATVDADLVVMGTVELANVKKRHNLGSVCMGIAQNLGGSNLCIVKRYAQ